MFDDIPKRSSLKKIFTVLIFLLIIGSTSYFLYQKYSANRFVVPKVLPTKIIESASSTVLSALSPGETYIDSSAADTNKDNLLETLVVARQSDGKFHLYVLSNKGSVLFDHKNLPSKPIRISTKNYLPTQDTFLSWILTMSENADDYFFVHWNGTAYEIPQKFF